MSLIYKLHPMKKYISIPENILDEPDDYWLCERIYLFVLGFFGNQHLPAKEIDSRTDIPEVAKNVWHLWLFATEVSSSGVPDYLLNHCSSVEQLVFTHRALKIIHADEMVMLLEAAIPLVRAEANAQGGFGEVADHDWMNQFQVNPLWSDRQRIAEQSCELAAPPFFLALAKYVRAHRTELHPQT